MGCGLQALQAWPGQGFCPVFQVGTEALSYSSKSLVFSFCVSVMYMCVVHRHIYVHMWVREGC